MISGAFVLHSQLSFEIPYADLPPVLVVGAAGSRGGLTTMRKRTASHGCAAGPPRGRGLEALLVLNLAFRRRCPMTPAPAPEAPWHGSDRRDDHGHERGPADLLLRSVGVALPHRSHKVLGFHARRGQRADRARDFLQVAHVSLMRLRRPSLTPS